MTEDQRLWIGVAGALLIRAAPLLSTIQAKKSDRGKLSRLISGMGTILVAFGAGVEDPMLLISVGFGGTTLSKGSYDAVKNSRILEIADNVTTMITGPEREDRDADAA